MLPTEAFAEAVAFLRLFDLSELAVTNALCSYLAVKASATIRWEQFPDFTFHISDTWIAMYRDFDILEHMVSLTFPKESDLGEFVAAAFPNCTFKSLRIVSSVGKHTMDAIGRVADSVIVEEALVHHRDMSPDNLLDLIRKFRKVKALYLYFPEELSDDEVKEMANEMAAKYRGSGIQDLFYYYSSNEREPTKVASY